MSTPTLSNEEAALFVTNIEGWICKTCRTFYGKEGERAARYCCEKDHACGTEGCAGRAEKSWIYCEGCNQKRDLARYLQMPEAEWDGETPLVLFDDDQFFFDIDSLRDHLEEHGLKIEEVRLVIAERDEPRLFEVQDFLCDYLGEEGEVDGADELDQLVNDWIEKHAPKMWVAGETRPTLKSLLEQTATQEG